MTTTNEHLSALVDGELSPPETGRVLADLASEPALRDLWSRYQLIGTAIRRGVPEVHDPQLAARIAAAVSVTEPEGAADGVPPSRPQAEGGRFRRVASGLAMAASVAAVALFGVRYVTSPEPQAPASRIATVAPAALQAQPVAATGDPATAPLDEQRLSDYLQRHNELALGGGLRTLPPYVRVVSANSQGLSR